MAAYLRLREREEATLVPAILDAEAQAEQHRRAAHTAALMIQRNWRGKAARLEVARLNAAAQQLQSAYRGLRGRKTARQHVCCPCQ